MELRVLKYFLGVARTGNITAAAHSLHITQPTLSRQLQDLESELGRKLFVRGSHHVTLTRDGMRLRQRAEEVLKIIEQTEAEFYAEDHSVSGDIYIGCGESEAMSLMAEIIGSFRSDYPQVRIHLHSGNAEDVMDYLDRGILDFGILIQPVDISRYNSLALPVRDRWGLILRKDHPLAKRKSISSEDAARVPLLVSKQVFRKEKLYGVIASWFGEIGSTVKIAGTYNLIFNAALLARAGVGCVLGLDRLIDRTGQSGLCFRPLKPILEVGLDIVWKKNRIFSDAAEKFLARLQEKLLQTDVFSRMR